MHINKLEIKGFGRLKEVSLDFTRRMNLIYGDNEAGKSTIQEFIRAMLYGLKGGKATGRGMPSPIKRYTPWGGENYSGAMEYTLENKERFRVNRNFEKDTVEIFDSSFNDITGTFDKSRGKGVLFAKSQMGLTENCFVKTAFVKQMETRIGNDGSKELLDRLSNVTQTGFQDVSFNRAQKALKEALKNYVGTEKTTVRPLDIINQRLEKLKEERPILVEKKKNLLDKTLEYNNTLEVLKKANEKMENLKISIKIHDLQETLSKTQRQEASRKEIDANINGLRAQLNEMDLAIEELECQITQKGICIDGEADYKRAVELSRELKKLKEEYEELDLERLGEKVTSHRERKRNRLVLTSVSAIILVASFVLGFLVRQEVYAVSLLAFAGSIWFGSSFFKASKQLDTLICEKRYSFITTTALKDKLTTNQNELDNILRNAGARDIEEFASKLKEYGDVDRDLSYLRQRKIDFENNLSLQLKRVDSLSNEGSSLSIDELEKQIEGMKEKLEEGHLGAFSKEIEEQEYRETEERIDSLRLKATSLETLINSSEYEGSELQQLDEEISELEEKRVQLEDKYFSIKTALDTLVEASGEIQKDFAPILNKKMSIAIERITGSKYSDIRAGNELDLKVLVPETGEVVGNPVFSGGTVDQLYMALRVAMSDIISHSQEKLPFIMDEVFAQYDDTRVCNTLEFLKDLSEERQIIFFTCKSREVDMAKQIFSDEINVINI